VEKASNSADISTISSVETLEGSREVWFWSSLDSVEGSEAVTQDSEELSVGGRDTSGAAGEASIFEPKGCANQKDMFLVKADGRRRKWATMYRLRLR
jgi:hypothetical protein